jgi:biotin synthase
MVSTMFETQIDATGAATDRIRSLARRVLSGGSVEPTEVEWLLELTDPIEIMELLGAAHRVRRKFRGDRIHLCSIVNIKAGGCPENCRFCAQSAVYETESPRSELSDPEPTLQVMQQAKGQSVQAVGIVAAWKELKTGASLDRVCDHVRQMAALDGVRADASLGMIGSFDIAVRLKQAGVVRYNHNLETSRRYFPEVCSTHSYDDRVQTLQWLRQAGIELCSGGIIGMGETRADRRDLAFALRELDPESVPINILNPIPGTPFAGVSPLSPFEILKTIACFRLVLPRQDILIAGGRGVNLRDLQSWIFWAGASGMMVGNYLTTDNRPVEKDLEMLRDLGLGG